MILLPSRPRAGRVRILANRSRLTLLHALYESPTILLLNELTALSQAGAQQLAAFAADYPAFLQSWEEAIETSLREPSL